MPLHTLINIFSFYLHSKCYKNPAKEKLSTVFIKPQPKGRTSRYCQRESSDICRLRNSDFAIKYYVRLPPACCYRIHVYGFHWFFASASIWRFHSANENEKAEHKTCQKLSNRTSREKEKQNKSFCLRSRMQFFVIVSPHFEPSRLSAFSEWCNNDFMPALSTNVKTPLMQCDSSLSPFSIRIIYSFAILPRKNIKAKKEN